MKSEGELKKRIQEVFKHDNWTEHLTDRQMSQEEVTLAIIDDVNKELEEIMAKYEGVELLYHIGQAWLEIQNWKNKQFGDSS